MRTLNRFLLVAFFVVAFGSITLGGPLRVVEGTIYMGGYSYTSPDYQTFISINLTARTNNPTRDIGVYAVQPLSVFLNHPIQPSGPYEYRVVMPYRPNQMTINGQSIYPVWFNESVWKIQSSILTPDVTLNSPAFTTVQAPFSMSGNLLSYGAYNIGMRMRGSGTVTMKFEKVGSKYYFFDAAYTFSSP